MNFRVQMIGSTFSRRIYRRDCVAIGLSLMLFMVFAFFSLSQTSADEAPTIPHISLLILAREGDSSAPMNPYMIQEREKDLQRLHPGTKVLIVRGKTNDEFAQGWQQHEILKVGRYITDAVCIESHGESKYRPPFGLLYSLAQSGVTNVVPTNSIQRIDWAKSYLYRDSGSSFFKYANKTPPVRDANVFYLSLVDSSSFDPVLSWAFKNLSVDARIIFSGCDILGLGNTDEEKLEIAIRIARTIGLQSGSVYFNHGPQGETERDAVGEAQLNGKKISQRESERLRRIDNGESTYYVTAGGGTSGPLNQGYLLKISKKDSEIAYELHRDNFINARENRDPRGPLLCKKSVVTK